MPRGLFGRAWHNVVDVGAAAAEECLSEEKRNADNASLAALAFPASASFTVASAILPPFTAFKGMLRVFTADRTGKKDMAFSLVWVYRLADSPSGLHRIALHCIVLYGRSVLHLI